jgi:polyphenol oxidase
MSDRRVSGGPSRRDFLVRSGLAAGGIGLMTAPIHAAGHRPSRGNPLNDCSPVPTPPANPALFVPEAGLPLRVRKSAFDLSDVEVARLRKAYALLRNLSQTQPDDPRGWLRQANVHCWYCGGPGGNEMGAGTEIHGSWRFLPWHRMFLYFHERILASLLDDPTFALPYWDWDKPGRNRLPPAYADPGTSDAPNPLLDTSRGAGTNDQIPDSGPMNIVGPDLIAQALAPQSFEGAGGFGGTPDGPSQSAGTLEDNPHGPVHIWTGDPSFQSASPDMGVLATAARDPIFFAHHANIDRLWAVWLDQTPAEGQPPRTNPTDAAWAVERFAFYDHNSPARWVSMAIGDTVDTAGSLRFVYAAGPEQAEGPGHSIVLPTTPAAAPNPLDLTAPDHSSIAIGLPEAARQTIHNELARPTPRRPTVVLHIDGIELPTDRQAVVRVFVDQPDADKNTPVNSPNFVGQFSILAMNRPMAAAPGHAMKAMHHNKTFRLNQALAAKLEAQPELKVKLVSVAGETKLPYRKAYLSIRR